MSETGDKLDAVVAASIMATKPVEGDEPSPAAIFEFGEAWDAGAWIARQGMDMIDFAHWFKDFINTVEPDISPEALQVAGPLMMTAFQFGAVWRDLKNEGSI